MLAETDIIWIHGVYPDKGSNMDSSGFRVRVEAKLRREFLEACRSQDRTAAQVMRDFMRDFVAKHYQGVQSGLFDPLTFAASRQDQ
jgi:hypothetical protein